MLIKRFIFKDPITDKSETVYEYPECLASVTLRYYSGCTLVTKELMRIPILVVPNEYLVDTGGREIDRSAYADLKYYSYHRDIQEKKFQNAVFDDKIQRVKELFGIGSSHLRRCKTMFFTGPKAVYKLSFDENWIYGDSQILKLEKWGHFKTIDSLSCKGLNDVFITGIFVCANTGDEMENTQCKITVSTA